MGRACEELSSPPMAAGLTKLAFVMDRSLGEFELKSRSMSPRELSSGAEEKSRKSSVVFIPKYPSVVGTEL